MSLLQATRIHLYPLEPAPSTISSCLTEHWAHPRHTIEEMRGKDQVKKPLLGTVNASYSQIKRGDSHAPYASLSHRPESKGRSHPSDFHLQDAARALGTDVMYKARYVPQLSIWNTKVQQKIIFGCML